MAPVTVSTNSQSLHIIQCNAQRVDQCGRIEGLDRDSCNRLRCDNHTGLIKHAQIPSTTLIYTLEYDVNSRSLGQRDQLSKLLDKLDKL